MNRKHQGQSSRPQQSQSPMRGNRMGSQNFSQDQDSDYEGMQMNSQYERPSSQMRDNDYDLEGSTYGRSQRDMGRDSQRDMGSRMSSPSSYHEYETNDRNRQPSRFSSLDEDRSSERYSDRTGSSSERFGYPSNMNAWSGSDRSFNSGKPAGRMGLGQSSFNSWGSQDQDYSQRASTAPTYGGQSHDQSYGSYGEGSLGNSYGSHSQSQSESQRGFFGKGPKGYRRSDERIKEEVCETLARNHRVDASDIEVTVEDACVTLSGTIDTREAKRAAEIAIENLSGVDDVKNEIRVKKADSFGESSSSYSSSSGAKASKGTTGSTKGSSHIS